MTQYFEEQHSNDANRRAWLSCLASAPAQTVLDLVEALGSRPEVEVLRKPEIGTCMVRGRMGGTGNAFNLGEMTVTRTSLRLSDGRVGHGYVQGRSRAHAEAAALCDALLQGGEHDVVMTKVIAPLMAARAAHKAERAAKAASTKVDFFTLVRGEAT